jgi:hypothetical protein
MIPASCKTSDISSRHTDLAALEAADLTGVGPLGEGSSGVLNNRVGKGVCTLRENDLDAAG